MWFEQDDHKLLLRTRHRTHSELPINTHMHVLSFIFEITISLKPEYAKYPLIMFDVSTATTTAKLVRIL